MANGKLRGKMPQTMAVRVYGKAFILSVLEDPTFCVGSYEQLRQQLNPLRLAEGYDEISTPGGVRGEGLCAAMDRYDVYVYADRSPLLMRNSPLLMEAMIRRMYGQEVLDLWRRTLYERGHPIASEDELALVFGPGAVWQPGAA